MLWEISLRLSHEVNGDWEFSVLPLELLQMLIYHSYLIDPVHAEKLFKATISRFSYAVEYDLDIELEFDGEELQELPLLELPSLINFINNQLILPLEVEVNNGNEEIFMSIWGINNHMLFRETLVSTDSFLGKMFEINCDNLDLDSEDFLRGLKSLRYFFQEAVNENSDYEVDLE